MTELKDIESLHGRIRTVLAYLDAPVLIVSANYKTAYINPAFEKAFGVNFRESLGKDFAHYLPPSAVEALVEAGEKIKAGAATRRFNLQVGKLFHSIGVSPITDDNARLTGMVFSFTDITKERQLETLKAEFISMLLNDLHAPLYEVIETFKRLESDFKPNDPHLHVIRKGSGIALDVMDHIERLLHITDSMSGEVKLNKNEYDVGLMVGSAVGSLRARAEREHVYLHTFPMILPPIYCDQDKLLQVIIHVVNNMITAASVGNHHPRSVAISGASSSENDPLYVYICIAETGRTLTEQEVPEMFLDDENSPPECDPGCLAISKIIAAHGGKMSLIGVENMGSAIVLTLPVR